MFGNWQLVRGETSWPGQVVAFVDEVGFPPAPIPLVLLCPSYVVVVASPGHFTVQGSLDITFDLTVLK